MFAGCGCSQQWQDPRLRLQQPVCPGTEPESQFMMMLKIMLQQVQ